MSEYYRWLDLEYTIEDHLNVDFPDELIPKLEVIQPGSTLRFHYRYDEGNPPSHNIVWGSLPADPPELEVLQVWVKPPDDSTFYMADIAEQFAIEWFCEVYALDKMEVELRD